MANEIGQPKIFCLGLPKTGTTSLFCAMRKLGLMAFHNPEPMWERLWNYEPFDGNWEAVCHFGFWHFEYFEKLWPGSKYIYLDRQDRQVWLESTCGQFLQLPSIETTDKQTKIRLYTFGSINYNEDAFRHVYERHRKQVLEFFSRLDPRNVLVWDLTKHPEWKHLCEFVGKQVPDDIPFPWENYMAPHRERARAISEETGRNVIFAQTDDVSSGLSEKKL